MALAPVPLDPDLMREVLECPICLETYGPEQPRPKLLQCGHTVCRQCLDKLLAATINGVRCPFCSRVSRMSSVSQLADNLTVLKILDCSAASGAAAALMCRSCRNRLPRLFCHDCSTVLCEPCAGEGRHRGHRLQPVRAAAEGRRQEAAAQLVALRDFTAEIQRKKAAVDNAAKSLRLKYRAVQRDYADAELRLQEELGCSRRAFAAAMAEVEKLNGRVLEEQTYLLDVAEAKAASRRDYLTTRAGQSDVALLNDDCGEDEEEEPDLRSGLPSVFQLQEPALLRAELATPLDVGRLTTNTYSVDADAEGSGPEAELDDHADGAAAALAADLYPDIDMVAAAEEAAVCGSPSYFKSKSMDAGGGSPGGGSPGGAAAPLCQFVKRMGCKGALPGMFNLPVSICVTPHGDVLVADRGNYRVQIFNRKGFQREIRRSASGIDNFVLSFLGADPPNLVPLSVAVTTQGLIGVTDDYDNSVKVYTMDGQCVACHKNQLVKPWGIAATPSGRFVVTDVEAGQLWSLAVERGAGVVGCSRLCSAVRPKFVTCDAAGTVYFTQGLAPGAEKRRDEPHLEGGFSVGSVGSDGRIGKRLSHFFSQEEDFRCIAGMSVDANGDLLVTDSGRKEILLFPRGGGFKVLVPEGLTCPVGVATTQRGQLLVLDCWDHCVKVYTYSQRRHTHAVDTHTH